MDTILFTPASLLDLLSKIDELSEYEIGVAETIDGQLQLTIGESTYLIDNDNATDVSVDETVVESIEDVNLDAYENLDDDIDVTIYDEGEPIESGILKEVAKTLLVGGLVRLGSKLLKWGERT